MSPDSPVVFVVDDDSRVRDALSSLIASVGLRVSSFGSASEFLNAEKPDAPACLVLDLELPDISGLDLQQELASREAPPIVFITGHGDVPSSVRAMKAGAVEFLSKPFGEQELLSAIDSRDRARSNDAAEAVGDRRAAATLRSSHAARTGSAALRGRRLPQQADRRRSGHQRDHDRGPSRPNHAEDGRPIVGRAGQNGRQARHPPARRPA